MPHKLEEILKAPANDIMDAILKGFRAQIDVKGKLSSFILQIYNIWKQHIIEGRVERYRWKTDFEFLYNGKKYLMECKNLRNKIYKRPPSYMVEIQRTRDSKQGLETRRYRVDHFDILAVCLFNQTQKWDYVFIRSKDLERWQEHPEYLEKMQRVPMTIEGLWKKDLIEILNSFEG
ncbi:hypothetical protein [Methanothrix soehngenii]|uniref:hypothetical protein n=1 Tax=Methanothrix soehngenii TaxID=2223 RepID=UPI00300CF0D6